MSRARVIAGAGVVLYVNGKPFGQVTSFQFSSSTPRKATYVLDQVEPAELAITNSRVSGSIGVLRTLGDGGAEGAGMVATFDQLPVEKYFTMSLTERGSDTTLFTAQYCAVEEQSWTVNNRGLMEGTVNFTALTWSNEVRNS